MVEVKYNFFTTPPANVTATFLSPGMSKYFLPFPERESTEHKNAACVLCCVLPAYVLYPDTCGAFSDMYRDPDKVRYMNIFLFLLACAEHTGVGAYIETIPDYEFMEGGVGTMPLFYRLLIVVNEVEAKSMILNMSRILIPDNEDGNGVPVSRAETGGNARKKRRKESNPGTEEKKRFENIQVSHKEINSEAAILQYNAMIHGGLVRDDQEVFYSPLPPDAILYGGANPGNNSDSDSDDDAYNVFAGDAIEGVSPQFKDWKDNLNAQNILNIFSIEEGFTNGTRDVVGIHPQQLDMSNYYNTADFRFKMPEFSIDNGLVVRIRPHWAGYNGSVDSLFDHYMLPGAHELMTSDDLMYKIESFCRFQGIEADPRLYDIPVDELKERFLSHGCFPTPYADGLYDASAESPILCRNEGDTDYTATIGRKTLKKLYPQEGKLRDNVQRLMKKIELAVDEGRLDADHLTKFREKYLMVAEQLYNGPAIEGFCPTMFEVAREATRIKRDFKQTRKSAIVERALVDILKPRPGMSPGQAIFANIAELFLHGMHLTNAQAGVAMLFWTCSVTTLRPIINCLQVSVLLLGPQDKGKSLAMDASLAGVPLPVTSKTDASSAKAFLAPKKPCAVQKQDEFKMSPEIMPMWLSQRSEGCIDYDQGFFDSTNAKAPMQTNNIMSDNRSTFIAGSNGYKGDAGQKGKTHSHQYPPQVLSRFMLFYFLGTADNGTSRSRHELASVPDGPAFFAAQAALKYIWVTCNDCSKVEGILPMSYNYSLHPVFVAIVLKMFGVGQIQTRDIARIKRCAVSFLQVRLFGEWIQMAEGPTKPKLFAEYVFANPVVLLQDYLQVFIQQGSNAEYEISEAHVIAVLKDATLIKESSDNILEMEGSEWYVTACKSSNDIQQRCTGGLSQADSLVKDIVGKLKTPVTVDGPPRLKVIMKKGDFTGHFAIHKSVMAMELSKKQALLMQFITEEVIVEAQAGLEDMWQIGLDESFVVLRRPVKQRLIGPVPANANLPYDDSATLRKLTLEEDGILRALLLFEAAGQMQFRESPFGADDVRVQIAHLSDVPGQNGTSIGRGGAFDDLRLFPEYFETDDDEVTDNIEKWATEEKFATLPKIEKRKKYPLPSIGGIKVSIELVQHCLDNLLRKRHGAPVVPKPQKTKEARIMKMKYLIDVLMAVTGEEDVGAHMFTGIDQAGEPKYETHQVRELNDAYIDIKNPLRSKIRGGGDALTESILPPNKFTVRLPFRPAGQKRLAQKLNEKAAAMNQMPKKYVRKY